MKNAIQYHYGINVDNIHQTNGIYKFSLGNIYYLLAPYEGDLKEIEYIYDLIVKMLTKGIYCHQIVMNSEKKLFTIINNVPYVLIKSEYNMDNKLIMENIIQFSNMTLQIDYKESLRRDNWAILWSNKIDYFEYQVNQFGKSYPNIRGSFSYFLGVAETGISLYNNIKFDYKNLVVAHKRIKKNSTLYDLYNPLNFVIDIRIRDACEYFKESFISNSDIYDDIITYFVENKLTEYEYKMFFVRMLYPSFYFDLFESIIKNNQDDKILIPIIDMADKYEYLLKRVYQYLLNFIVLPDIEWLKKT